MVGGFPLEGSEEGGCEGMAEKRKLTFIDLFAGCGGLSLGMEQAGFSPVFANEIWNVAAETYRRNRGLDESQVFVAG